MKTVKDVVAAIQLRDVRLKECSAQTSIRDAKGFPRPNLGISHGTRVIHRSSDAFIVGARFTARVEPGEGQSNEPPLSIDVTFALTYTLPSASDFPDDLLEQFAKVNGVFNAWPYWREYVQTTLARMSLPPLVLPVFRLGPAAAHEEAIDAKTSETATKSLPDAGDRSGARKAARKKR